MDKFEFHIKIPIHPRAKFGLKALLLGTLLVGIGFGAYKYGKERGRRAGYSQGYESGWSDSQRSKLTKRQYPVSDLVIAGPGTPADFGSLISDIQNAVDQTSWGAKGGPAEISPYPQSLSIVVHQTQRGHEALELFLAKRRAAKVLEAP
ncbi:hypothetical protein FYK55_27760 [Roseiconus nitratireducens]|uniref:Uncharacterized protein n=1 Tax=Roseiconus nitratireducens TaxID=2605748 RepID=A0A5M6CS33_9BACT|nr:hypothetical protein [Roseiconus nitratireducens]KAA5538017.1 hypothetical protein FYK55_27760 [Roseiconus nitratireducens]